MLIWQPLPALLTALCHRCSSTESHSTAAGRSLIMQLGCNNRARKSTGSHCNGLHSCPHVTSPKPCHAVASALHRLRTSRKLWNIM